MKVAGEKSTWPGKKEVYRIGTFEEDVVQLADEPKPQGATRLLKPVIVDGELVPGALPPLSEIWELARNNMRDLPEEYKELRPKRLYPVRFSKALTELRDRLIAEYAAKGPA